MTELIKNSSLLLPCPEVKYSRHSKTSAMYKNTKITTKGTTGWISLDLSDFPHGSLIGVNKKNGYDIEFYSVPEGTLVPAYDENSGEIVAAEVSAWSIHRGREVEIVTLADGSQIFTDNDPRAVYGIGKNASTLIPTRWTPTEALRENVVVPVDPETIPEIVAEKQYYDMLTNELCQERRNSFTVKLDYDFGQVVGCLCGDGWISEGNFTPRTNISDKECDNATFILEYLRRTVLPGCTMCSVEVKNRKNKYGTSITHTYYHKNKGVVSLAMKNLIGGESFNGTSGALNKHLPTWYTVANKDFLRGLVNGLVATDGTISVVKAADKNKPQLMIAITSVSLRMLREAKRVLAMLGVPSTISKSKITTANNVSWCLFISCPQAKKQNLFANCCMKRKAKTFTDTEVSTEAVAIKLDYVPFPKCVSSAIVPNFKAIKVSKKYKEQHPELTEEQWAARVNQSGFACELRADASRGYITRAKAKNILAKLENIDNERLKAYTNGKLILAEPRTDAKGKFILDGTTRDVLRTALDALIPSMRKDKAEERDKAKELLSNAVRKAHVREEAYRAVDALFSTCEFFFIKDTDLILDWKRLINTTIKWMPITQVEKTGKTETGYDLTVPGYETFMNSDGVILSNTINVHVPSSPAAVKEAFDVMMASKTPFSDRSEGKLVPLPKQEQVLGLYTAATAPTTQKFDFPSEQDAIAAIRQGKVPLSADVTIRGKSY